VSPTADKVKLGVAGGAVVVGGNVVDVVEVVVVVVERVAT
jgi:hypothetical protein